MFFAGSLHKSIIRFRTVTVLGQLARAGGTFSSRKSSSRGSSSSSWRQKERVADESCCCRWTSVTLTHLTRGGTASLLCWLRGGEAASHSLNGCEERFCFLCTALTSSSAISLRFPHLSRPLISSTVSAAGCLSIFNRTTARHTVPTMPLHLLPCVFPLFHQPSLHTVIPPSSVTFSLALALLTHTCKVLTVALCPIIAPAVWA